jgi:mercuric ion transport protein
MSAPDNGKALLRIGLVGSIVAALCCFSPVLVIGLTAIGLASVLGWIDYVVLPSLAMFLMLTGYALWKRKLAISS